MNRTISLACLALLAVPVPLALAAQDHEMHEDEGMRHAVHNTVIMDFIHDLKTVEEKVAGLAEAIPEEAWSWRPGEGVRSVQEVFQHITADNYLIPAMVGYEMPSHIDFDPDDYSTVRAWETRDLDPEAVRAELAESWEYLFEVMHGVAPERLDEKVMLFGSERSRRAMWVLTTTHLHEHLGQLIAYARSNDVVPPWSM